MSTITILGLGPGDAALLTRAAWDLLQKTRVLYLRTAIHPTVADLPAQIELRPFDALYETAEEFEQIYDQIAAQLVERASAGEAIVYAVPGHPLVAEASSRHLLALARKRQIPTRIVAGLSFLDPVCTALELDPLEHGMQLIDALDLMPSSKLRVESSKESIPPTLNSQLSTLNSDGAWSEIQGIGPYVPALVPFPLTPTLPALICQLYNRRIASHTKLSLMERYPAEHPVTLIQAASVPGAERIWSVPLHELDHQHALDHLTCAYVPALAPLTDLRGPDGVTYVVARLLGPGGCPWDREQTHQSLRRDLLEETHEVLEALDSEDMEALAEELGDLLLHVLMHAEMARQAGDFDMGTVYKQIAAKLIRRHPHVFATTDVSGSDEVVRNWEEIKRAERAAKGQESRGLLDGVPAGLPALMAAQEVTRKAARAGFDWPEEGDIWRKLHEELAELGEAIEQRSTSPDEYTRRLAEECGDLFLIATRLAAWLNVDAESALRMAVKKFRRRFAHVEAQLQAQGQDLMALSTAEKLALWRQAKDYDE